MTTWLLGAAVCLWLGVTLLAQLPARFSQPVRRLDPFGLLPAWSFFAPHPGVTDTVIVVRAGGRLVAAVRAKLVDNATRIEAARLLTYRAASMKDAGRRTTLEAAMAKLYSSEIAVRASEDGVQIHGGYGFVKDYPAEKYFRDVKLTTIGEGTSEIQRLVIARQLLQAG